MRLNTCHKAQTAYLSPSGCTTGYQSKIHGSVRRFGTRALAPGTSGADVRRAELPLTQWVMTVIPGTQRPSNLTCLLAEVENLFRPDLGLSAWIIHLVCLDRHWIGPCLTPKAWLMVPPPDLVPDSPLASQRKSIQIFWSFEFL